MTGGTEQDRRADEPNQPDDEYPDLLWPAEDDERDDARTGSRERDESASSRAGVAGGAPVSFQWGMPPAPAQAPPVSRSRRSLLALAGTAVLACGLGAGAMLAYRAALPRSAPEPAGQGVRPIGHSTVEDVGLVGRVTAVGSSTITIAGRPGLSVTAAVTPATRITGTVRTLAQVHKGDTVDAQITIVNGVARVLSLQDPASDS
jgi:hypothetical protein